MVSGSPLVGNKFIDASSCGQLVYGAFTAVANCRVEVAGHMWLVQLTSQNFIDVRLAMISRQFHVVRKVEEVWPKRFWYYSLYCAIEGGSAFQNAMKIV